MADRGDCGSQCIRIIHHVPCVQARVRTHTPCYILLSLVPEEIDDIWGASV